MPCPALANCFVINAFQPFGAPVLNARRAARELALFCLMQPDRLQPDGDPKDIPAALHSVVRVMVEEAQDNLHSAVTDLQAVYRAVQDVEWDHPDNTHSGLDTATVPVRMPKTDTTKALIERCLKAADLLQASMSVPVLKVHTQNPDTVYHAKNLVQLVQRHQPELDYRLNQCMDEWRMERLYRLDACILRLALAEMMLVDTVDVGISINEAVELAKQYSSEDSYRLINGVLGKASQRVREPLEQPPVIPVTLRPTPDDITIVDV
jgi:transcription antitermination protein NusB